MNDQARSLVDRYIYAIRRLLPRTQRDDIAAELREALESQVDSEESRAGRFLHGEEIAAILKRFGQPREVAARYGSQQFLIGPDVFPSYMMAVKIVLWFMVPVTVFLVLLSIVTAEDHLFGRLLNTLWTVLSIGLVNLSIVTLMFVYFGRASSGNLNDDADWDLDDLPEVPADPNAPLPRSELIGSLVGFVLMLCWWLGLNAALQRWFGWGALPIVWTPVWADLTVAAVSILVAGIVRELMGLIRPHWIRTYLASGAILDVLALPVLFRLLAADNYVAVASGTGQSPMGIFAFVFNAMIFVGLILMSLIAVFDCVRDVARLVHVSRIPFRTSPGSRV